jgi:hypothetical protein
MRLPVPRLRTDAAFVRIAGATMMVRAANGLVARESIGAMSLPSFRPVQELA